MSDRPSVFVHLLPSLIPPDALRGGVAVVIDVLRATTVMVQALDSGIDSIRPCLEIEEAQALAATFSDKSVILGGERRGLPIEGFDLGNSPSSYTSEICRGRTLVMTTTNGTRAIHASLNADRVFIAAFSNLDATWNLIKDLPRVHLICAGTDGEVSWEDTLLAGFFVSAFNKIGTRIGNDSAEMARSIVWSEWETRDYGQSDQDEMTRDFAALLSRGRGGQRVNTIGLGRDILDAAGINRFDFAAELRREPLRIERV